MKRRLIRHGMSVAIDFVVLSAAFWAAFLFRFEFDLSLATTKLLFFTWPYVVVLQYVSLAAFDIPRGSWAYFSTREAWRVAAASGVATLALVIMRLTLGPLGGYASFVSIPLGVLAMDFVLVICGIVGIRMIRRAQLEQSEKRTRSSVDEVRPRTLLIGAGRIGAAVARELQLRPDIGITPVGFIDDDPLKRGTTIHGLRVLGTGRELADVAARHGATDAVISIARATGREVRHLTTLCRQAGLSARIVPGLGEIVGGQVNVSAIRPVAIEDLLRRKPVRLDVEGIAAVVRDRVIVVTGAGGSIGSELARQVCRWSPARLVLVERAENALFFIHRELAAAHPELSIAPSLGDVTDRIRIDAIFSEHAPDVILHAAAHKHVPMMEWNPGESVKNNILGTLTVAELAEAHRVREFVLISTDKAVRPTSIMGATKRVAERTVRAVARLGGGSTRFVAVRFGNVLGSAGSVVPIFKRQIESGGPVTVTHPEMTRYFMTIPEACQLVLQAAALGSGGELYILDMGEPVKIRDLAEDLIRLSGLTPGEDIEVVYSGVRPGEKLFEELSQDDEGLDRTAHEKIFMGRLRESGAPEVLEEVRALIACAQAGGDIVPGLRQLVPEYSAPNGVSLEAPVPSKPDASAPSEPRKPRFPASRLSVSDAQPG